MIEFSGTNVRQLLLCGFISIVVFVVYSVPLFSRTYSLLDIGFKIPTFVVASIAALVGLLQGLIFGVLTSIFQINSILLSCVLSVVATCVLPGTSLLVIWFLDPDRPRGEFPGFYFGWLRFAFIMFFVPSVISGLLANVLIWN